MKWTKIGHKSLKFDFYVLKKPLEENSNIKKSMNSLNEGNKMPEVVFETHFLSLINRTGPISPRWSCQIANWNSWRLKMCLKLEPDLYCQLKVPIRLKHVSTQQIFSFLEFTPYRLWKSAHCGQSWRDGRISFWVESRDELNLSQNWVKIEL